MNETIEELIKLYETDIAFKDYCNRSAFCMINKGEISATPFTYKNKVVGLIFFNYFEHISELITEIMQYNRLRVYYLEFELKHEARIQEAQQRAEIEKKAMIDFYKKQARLI